MLYIFPSASHREVILKISQQRLVQHQHGAGLHARPNKSWADPSEPTGHALGLVYDLQARDDGRCVEGGGAMRFEGGGGRGSRYQPGLERGGFCGGRGGVVLGGRCVERCGFGRLFGPDRGVIVLGLYARLDDVQGCCDDPGHASCACCRCNFKRQSNVIGAHVFLGPASLFFVEGELQC